MQEIFNLELPRMNPYTQQMDKFSNSLKKLSNMVLHLEQEKNEFTARELQEMYDQITDKLCSQCENKEECLGKQPQRIQELIYLILETIEHYGIELNMEVKRKLQRDCVLAPRFLRETVEVFGNYKQIYLWNHRLERNLKTYALQMDTFASALSDTAKELDAGVIEESWSAKKLQKQLEKTGVRYLNSIFFVTTQGQYQVHLTMQAGTDICVPMTEVIRIVSDCLGKKMETSPGTPQVVGKTIQTVLFQEVAAYYTLSGISRVSKGNNQVSGDSFALLNMPGGKAAAVLSDGMGAGPQAYKESSQVVDMLEELLEAGFPEKTAISMINIALVMGREEIRFSTVDMAVIDLYTAGCRFLKAGATTSYIKRQGELIKIPSDSLPLGVVQQLHLEEFEVTLKPEDVIIMMSDGVFDTISIPEQEFLMDTILKGTNNTSPKSLAEHIMQQMLSFSCVEPKDDMSVLTIGIWKNE